jgi:hypothetical protein
MRFFGLKVSDLQKFTTGCQHSMVFVTAKYVQVEVAELVPVMNYHYAHSHQQLTETLKNSEY